jgi:hypothetical protein
LKASRLRYPARRSTNPIPTPPANEAVLPFFIYHYNTKPQRSYTPPSKEFYKTPKNNPSEEYPLRMFEYLTKKMF